MATIGVVHGPLTAGGGAETVAAHTVAALASAGHDVTVYTTAGADRATLSETADVRIPPAVDVERVRTPEVAAVDWLTVLTGPLGVTDMPLLRQAALERVVARRYSARQDLLVCTHGEFAVEDAIEYVHFPYFSATAMRRYDTRFEERLYPAYHWLCRGVKRRDSCGPATTLTNSQWTADVIDETLGRDADVIYPPVATAAFDPPPWAEQEPGFVSVGRLHPLKRQRSLIQLLDRLHAQGYTDTHLHIVGGVGDATYANTLRELASSRSYVDVCGRLSRERLVGLLETHRYGLHARRFEHFGVAVAEMVAAGSLPFVHRSGGQQAVVAHIDDLLYEDIDEACEAVGRILDAPERQAALRDRLADHADQYNPDRFAEAIQTVVAETLQDS